MWLRGLFVWIGAALLGAIAGTLALNLLTGGSWDAWDRRFLTGMVVMTSIFTVAGSAFLFLAYAALLRRGLHSLVRYGVLLVIGTVAGAVVLELSTLSPFGALYGALTTLAWIALLKLTRLERPA